MPDPRDLLICLDNNMPPTANAATVTSLFTIIFLLNKARGAVCEAGCNTVSIRA
ncbi:MAG: hypothetical protein ACJ8G3_02510 [Burkholderiaceae bacterium]